MVTVCYDGSWEGLLTSIFEVYEYKLEVSRIAKGENIQQQDIFGIRHNVVVNKQKSDRVRKGIEREVGKDGFQELFHAYLSELPEVDMLILRLVRYYFKGVDGATKNYAHDDVLRLKQINKSVSRERHRFKAFVRFKLLKDGLYYAHVEPDFNVLPLIAKHFKDRYSDQKWLIYDLKRAYGIFYDGENTVQEVILAMEGEVARLPDICAEEEALYDTLWKQYFKSTNITERKNNKLHLQHVPRRYWKYLNEKDLLG